MSSLALFLGIALQGCGGGGDGGAAPSVSAAPAVGTTQTFAISNTDNSNNLIHWTLQSKVISVAADGSFVETNLGLGPDVTVNGIPYGNLDETLHYDASGSEQGYVEGTLSCNYDQPKPRLPFNLPVGVAWPVVTSHLVCSDGSAYDETREAGSVVGVETITVPAGTYSATKVQFTRVVQFLAVPLVRTETYTDWFDPVSGALLQSVVGFGFTGAAAPTNFIANQVEQLLPQT